MTSVVAIDLGASSGRVLRGSLSQGRLEVEECHRFTHAPVWVPDSGGGDYEWSLLGLWDNICHGLREAARRGPIDAIGVDSWAVDYALLNDQGRLVRNPYCYRSLRTASHIRAFFDVIEPEELYAHQGIQFQPFNTMFQLMADRDDTRTVGASRFLLLPDLITYWLTGVERCEVTNASTTGLLNPSTRTWDQWVRRSMIDTCGIDPVLAAAPLVEPGSILGRVTIDSLGLRDSGGQATRVVAVGSHDTASAVVAVPLPDDVPCVYISSGTWSLVGTEMRAPVCTQESFAANFTNELGVDGTVRHLKNVMGLWVQQEFLRQWAAEHPTDDLSWSRVNYLAESAPPSRALIDINDSIFLTPGGMRERIDTWLSERGGHHPTDLGGYLRLITESLAAAYRVAIRQIREVTGIEPAQVHIVGGGSRNRLLCQLTADATGLPVVAGPAEGTAVGNMLVQLRALGALRGGLSALRSIVAASSALERYVPTAGDEAAGAWADHRP